MAGGAAQWTSGMINPRHPDSKRNRRPLGLAALLLAVGTIGLVTVGLIGFWPSSMIALLLFVVAGLVLPFGLAVSLRRS